MMQSSDEAMMCSSGELIRVVRSWPRYACAVLLWTFALTMPLKSHAKSLQDAMFELGMAVYRLDPALSDRMEKARHEFIEVTDQVVRELGRSNVALRRSHGSADLGLLTKARSQTLMSIFPLPRALYLGSVRRAAINFVQEPAIFFDMELWERASRQERRLLVLVEHGRFAGIEAEDDRYRFAARVLTQIQEAPDYATISDAFDMNFAEQGDYMPFDKDKIFLSFNFEGEDGTRVYLMNPYAEAIHGKLCQDPAKGTPNPYESRDAARRLYEVGLSFPDTVAFCEKLLVQRRPMWARVIFSNLSLHMTTCMP